MKTPAELISEIENAIQTLKGTYPPKPNFGQLLKIKRKSKGLNQKELGTILGLTDVSVSNLEKRTTLPRAATLKKLATAFECEIKDLIP